MASMDEFQSEFWMMEGLKLEGRTGMN